MKIYKDESLSSFEFWSGAKDTIKHLTDEELNTVEDTLKELFPEGMSETELNDFIWFEDDTIAEWLGFSDWENLLEREEEEEEEEKQE